MIRFIRKFGKTERGSVTLTSEALALTVIGMLAFVSYEIMYRSACQASNSSTVAEMGSCPSVLWCDNGATGSSSSSTSSSSTSSSGTPDLKVRVLKNDKYILAKQVEYMDQVATKYNYTDYAVATKYSDYTERTRVDTRAPTEQASGCDLLESWFNLNSSSGESSSSTSSSSSGGGSSGSAKSADTKLRLVEDYAVFD